MAMGDDRIPIADAVPLEWVQELIAERDRYLEFAAMVLYWASRHEGDTLANGFLLAAEEGGIDLAGVVDKWNAEYERRAAPKAAKGDPYRLNKKLRRAENERDEYRERIARSREYHARAMKAGAGDDLAWYGYKRALDEIDPEAT